MHHFFLDPALLPRTIPARMLLPDKEAHQVRDVLRLSIGERLVLLDNSGDELLASVTGSSRAGVEVELIERRAGKPELSVRIVLCQGLLKSARFEWILEKGVELGVSAFIPILCRRSMTGLEDAGLAKMQRWQRIAQEAAEQCGRSRLPQLLAIRPLIHALDSITPQTLALMLWEEEQTYTLRDALTAHRTAKALAVPDASHNPAAALTVMLFIGPEGGLDAEEVALAQRYGAQVVTLGRRILRAETAALAAVANVLYELER